MRTLAIAWVVCLDWRRRKDAYVFLGLLLILLLTLTSIDMFGLRGTVRYALDIGLLLMWLFGWIVALNAGSRELPQEESRGTIYMVLSKSVARHQFVLGKWFGAWLATCAFMLICYAAAWIVVLCHGERVAPLVYAQAYLLHAAGLAPIVALALLCSTRMGRDAAATVSGIVTVASVLLVPRIPALISQGAAWRAMALYGLYYLLPHFELFDLRRRVVHEFGPLDAATCATILAYGAVLTLILLAWAWLAYNGKHFQRDRLAE